MNDEKFTNDLRSKLSQVKTTDVVDVILELSPTENEGESSGTREATIAAVKEAFGRTVAPVEEAIRRAGGEVIGQAWINQTIRVRVPAQGVGELSEIDKITTLDVPHLIRRD